MIQNIPAFVRMIALPLAAAPFIYLIGRLGDDPKSSGKQINAARWAILIVMLGSWIPFYNAYRDFVAIGPYSTTYGMISLRVDGISLMVAATALLLGTLVAIYSGPYLEHDPGQEKYYALLSILVGTMMGLACAGDLFNLWVWFETMAISTYMLVAFYRSQSGALEAGVKYLVQSATGSALVIFGIALVFAQTGTLSLMQIRMVAQPSPLLMAAGALFVIGFGVKAAIIPLHTWLPDAHSMAPSGISAMLSGIVIETGMVAMLRALGALSGITTAWGPMLLIFGVLNMTVGNLMALRQTQVKRMLAYSSLLNVGYMLVGIGVAVTFNQINGAEGSMFHLFTHGLMKSLAFLGIGAMLYALLIMRGKDRPLELDDLSGAGRRYPLEAFTITISLFALGGLPLMAGFMSKWQIFLSGIQTQNPWMIALIIYAGLNSMFCLVYYTPVIARMYRTKMSDVVAEGAPVPLLIKIPLVVFTILIIAIGVFPAMMNWLVGPAGAALLASFGG